jgi:hypothetical protein
MVRALENQPGQKNEKEKGNKCFAARLTDQLEFGQLRKIEKGCNRVVCV